MKEHRIELKDSGRQISSVGIPLDNISIEIGDDSGTDLGTNRVGEILIKSDCMLEGYHNNPKATTSAFLDGWFKTGDLGFIHAGKLYVTGRKKELIVVGGENIYPQDIEALLNEVDFLIPGRNVVFGLLDERLGTERIVALAECTKGFENQDTTPIRKRMADELSVTISDLVLLPHMTLLKGTAGKISRHLNKAEYIKRTFDKHIQTTTSSDESGKLKQLVLEIFTGSNPPSIQMDTPLFSSGLIDSFGLLDLINAIEAEYHLKIPQSFCRADNFDSLNEIKNTLEKLREKAAKPASEAVTQASPLPKNWREFIKRLIAG
jgi:acyl carrier protein